MSGIRVKICGLKRKKDVESCLELKVDILGFVVEYPLHVPWNLRRDEAAALVRMVHPPQQSCIVTGGTPDKIIDLALYLRPSLVQLHYRETIEETVRIAAELQKHHIGVIKAIPPAKEERISQFGTADIKAVVKMLCQTGIRALLVDPRMPANASAAGMRPDISLCRKIIGLSSKPIIIAGGINAENVAAIIRQTGACCIDVMTGVERRPGVKDKNLLIRLLEASRRPFLLVSGFPFYEERRNLQI